MTVPVIYRVAPRPLAGIGQSAEFFGEQFEEIPYPEGVLLSSESPSWPPAGFASVSNEDSVTNPTLSSHLPAPYDLEWVQGDTAEFSWLFTDVLWTETDPEIEDGPTWVQTEWAAQVRNPYLFSAMSADRWTPVNNSQYAWWRSNSLVAEFTATAEAVEVPGTDPVQWATKVTITLPADRSRKMLPGNQYRWDLQTRNPGLTDDKADDVVRTHLSGRARVLTQWTTS